MLPCVDPKVVEAIEKRFVFVAQRMLKGFHSTLTTALRGASIEHLERVADDAAKRNDYAYAGAAREAIAFVRELEQMGEADPDQVPCWDYDPKTQSFQRIS